MISKWRFDDLSDVRATKAFDDSAEIWKQLERISVTEDPVNRTVY